MPYVGNEPTSNFASVTKDSFSGDGSTTAFTLSKASTTNGVAVFVENVRQEPTTAYAVSGTTLTFTAAPVSASGNNIYVLHHNAPASTANHPSSQSLTAVNGTMTGTLAVTGTSTLTGAVSTGGALTVANGLTLTDGDITVASGHGVNFAATSDGTTMASELLDDYEEGSFTPTVISTSFTPSYNHQYGFYTKIGNKVTFEIYLAISSASGTTTNACTFGGLPFTSYNGSSASRYAGAVTVGSWYNGVVAQQGVPHIYVNPNATNMICAYWDGSTGVQMVGGDVDGNSFLYFGGFYQAA